MGRRLDKHIARVKDSPLCWPKNLGVPPWQLRAGEISPRVDGAVHRQEGSETCILWQGANKIIVHSQPDFIKQNLFSFSFKSKCNPAEME